MDNSQSASSTLDTLRTVEFRLGLKGYNVDEVDEYLDKAAQEAEALQEHVRQLNERLRQASDRIGQLESEKRSEPDDTQAVLAVLPEIVEPVADPGPSDDSLQRTLVLAQKFVDQTKRESEAEAAAIVTAGRTAGAARCTPRPRSTCARTWRDLRPAGPSWPLTSRAWLDTSSRSGIGCAAHSRRSSNGSMRTCSRPIR